MTAPQPEQPSGRRRWPTSTFGGLIYLVVVAVTGVGFGLVAFGPWRRGITVVGIGFLFAAGMRLIIGEDEAGMLRVTRMDGRRIDRLEFIPAPDTEDEPPAEAMAHDAPGARPTDDASATGKEAQR